MGMTPHPTVRRRNNRAFLATLTLGDPFRLRYRDHQTGQSHAVKLLYVRVEGDTLIALDGSNHERRFALGFCSCSQFTSPKGTKQCSAGSSAHKGE